MKTGHSSTVSFYGFKTMTERQRKHLGIILMTLLLCLDQIPANLNPQHDTHMYRVRLSGQEIKVGRSIQESPLTLLPSYTTWNSTTEEESHRRRHPSVVITILTITTHFSFYV